MWSATTLSGARRFASSGQRRPRHGARDERAHAAVGDDRAARCAGVRGSGSRIGHCSEPPGSVNRVRGIGRSGAAVEAPPRHEWLRCEEEPAPSAPKRRPVSEAVIGGARPRRITRPGMSSGRVARGGQTERGRPSPPRSPLRGRGNDCRQFPTRSCSAGTDRQPAVGARGPRPTWARPRRATRLPARRVLPTSVRVEDAALHAAGDGDELGR